MNDSKRLFDGALLSVALAAVLISVMAVIAMVTRPDTVVVAAEGGGADGGTEDVRAHITLSEFSIDGDLWVPPGNLVIELHTEGGIQHNLQFDGDEISPMVNSGESLEFEIGNVEPGEYAIICEVPGHSAAGMTATLVVDPEASMDDLGAAHGRAVITARTPTGRPSTRSCSTPFGRSQPRPKVSATSCWSRPSPMTAPRSSS